MRRWGRRGWRSRGVRRRSGGAAGGKKPNRRRRLVLFLALLFLIFFFQTFIFVERNLQKPLMAVAQVRVKQEATQAINKSITDQVAETTNADKLIEWKTNAAGKISGFMLNYSEHMRITSETIDTVQRTLDRMGDIPEKIPLGQALGSAIIASFGPRIPVKFEPIGAVKVDLNTRQKDAGINMILVEVYMHIVAEVSIIIPFDTKPELVETEIPISYLLVVGDVPTYYYDGNGKPVGDSAPNAPSIAIPANPGAKEGDAAGSGGSAGADGGSAPDENALPADADAGADEADADS
ncbi:sporulation protein YunB [Paenibacillus sp. MWE-103]|uniref:Sporulation protein YunB n=1 Tax=Paenibacillus artemisiicola TaxID=1172618 RepID=A0ABS3WHL4_9BACL|nr:sporulation protein YunB [Paenibacillus artemisiicola]MBO7747733.1 sporulation protein YunB [Paenibacillus artemisiicola]